MEKLFRAWNKKTRTWHGQDDPRNLLFVDFQMFGECTMTCTPSPSILKDLVITQYIGRDDINGVKIYEGDICKGQYAGGNKEYYTNEIKWDDNACAFSFANSPIWTWEQLEVVGNVFETK